MYRKLLSGEDINRFAKLTTRDIGESTCWSVEHLFNYMVKDNCQVVLELGVRSGVSTRALLFGCKVTGGHLWSVDISNPTIPEIESWGLSQYWTFIKNDDLNIKWNKPLDLLFIDTTHTFEQTILELEKYAPHVKYERCVFLHDSLMNHIDGWGVLKAIKHFISKHDNWDFHETDVKGGLAILTKYYPTPFIWLFGE